MNDKLPIDRVVPFCEYLTMAKRKSARSTSKKSSKEDKGLMLLAAIAAIIVAGFSIFAYRAQSPAVMPTPATVVKTLNLSADNNSGQTGTATLSEVDGKVTVTLNLTGEATGASEPAHIHLGSCPNPGAVKYPLSSVVNGTSVTTLDVTLDQLKAMEPLAINVHKSASQINWYISCGNLNL